MYKVGTSCDWPTDVQPLVQQITIGCFLVGCQGQLMLTTTSIGSAGSTLGDQSLIIFELAKLGSNMEIAFARLTSAIFRCASLLCLRLLGFVRFTPTFSIFKRM